MNKKTHPSLTTNNCQLPTTHYDCVIVGAGPASAMLARLLQNRYKIALLDARPLDRPYQPGDRVKSCGGLIAPDAQKFLKKQKMTIPTNVMNKEQSPYVTTTDFDIGITRKFKRNYLNVDREKFDRWLLKGLKTDTYFNQLIKNIKQEKEKFIITLNPSLSTNHCSLITADRLIGADGAGSIVRRKFFPNFKPRQYASIQHVFNTELVDGMHCYFDETISDYYGWSLNKNSKTYLGYAIPEGQNAKEKFNKFIQNALAPCEHNLASPIKGEEELPRTCSRLATPVRGTNPSSNSGKDFPQPISQEGTTIIRPNFFHPVTCSKNIFLIGEAGGYISPSSAEGISYAFKTAQILADSNLNQKTFKFKMLSIQINLFYKSLKGILMYTPCIRHLIMKLAFWK